ncbi:MAG: putative DNA binding domain-containing protein [Methanomassiliicoccaceae archaeon]|nr:putative DNA binding domain-containing protein [Methanomassiliicoccaceae archaeon]
MKEDLRTEFKESWSDKCLRSVAGLGNAEGGTLYIGIDDKGKIVGVKDLKGLLKLIPDQIHNKFGIVPTIDDHSENSKEYISIKVSKQDDVLFCDGKVYVRSGSTTRELRGRELRTYFIKRFNMSWTDDPCPQITIKQLDNVFYWEFKNKALEKGMITQEEYDADIETMFNKLDLSADGKPKLGAVLLFHPEPQRFTAAACVKIGSFSLSGGDIYFQDLVEGPLFMTPDKIVELIMMKYTTSPISFEGNYRTQKPSYPREAIKEAVLNSIIHSDYGTMTPIQIKVFPDSLTIFNDGSPPIDWTVETLLKSHRSHPGNPSMATVFYRAGMVESFGRGIKKIMDAYKGRDAKPPVFEFTQSEFNVTFFNENYVVNVIKNEPHPIDKTTDAVKLDRLDRLVYDTIKNDKGKNIVSLMSETGLSRASVNRAIRSLKALGLIERVGTRQNGHYKVN